MNLDSRVRPVTDDPDTSEFFTAASQDKLVFCACGVCDAVLNPPRSYCAECGAWQSEWRAASGRGRLFSWTTVEHQAHRSFPAPYTIVLIDLVDEPDVRLMGYLPGRPELEAGMPMQVWFDRLDDDTCLPQWREETQE